MPVKIKETLIQQSYFDWVRIMANGDDRYANIIAIPNQGFQGGAQWGKKRLSEGMSKGFPDVMICWPSLCRYPTGVFQHYGGAFIEFKSSTGRLSKEQIGWFGKLTKGGFLCVVSRSLQSASLFTKEYIEGNYGRV